MITGKFIWSADDVNRMDNTTLRVVNCLDDFALEKGEVVGVVINNIITKLGVVCSADYVCYTNENLNILNVLELGRVYNFEELPLNLKIETRITTNRFLR